MKKLFNWLPEIISVGIMFILLVILASLGGCTTAEKLTYKAISKDKAKVAEITRAEFPCTTTKADTVISTKDSLIWIECPDNTVVTAADYTGIDFDNIPDSVKAKMASDTWKIGMGDTKLPLLHIVGQPKKTVRVPVTLPVKTVTIVQKVEDSAKIYVLQAATLKLQADNDKLRGKVHSRNTWLKWLIIALLISAGLNFIQFKRKLFFK